jgi:hypothetical protein
VDTVRFASLFSAQTVQDSAGRQFRIQGSNDARDAFTEVYMSSDGGQRWNLQGQLLSETGRYLGTAVVDSRDTIYVMMGQIGGTLLSDMWKSSNQGKTWQQISVSRTAAPPARSVHGSVVGKFRDGTDVIYIMYGYKETAGGEIGNVYRNDVRLTQHALSLLLQCSVAMLMLLSPLLCSSLLLRCGSQLRAARAGPSCCLPLRGRSAATARWRSPRPA